MRPTFDFSEHLLWALPVLMGLLLALVLRVRSRLRLANPQCLERLRNQGLLGGDAGQECQRLTHLLAAIAPAVWLRERISIRLYTCTICSLHSWLPGLRLLQREVRLLTAYQAHRYLDASQLLQHLRDDSHWDPVRPQPWQSLSRPISSPISNSKMSE